jgi:pimeloyl-ACP methyl ester carboxylesterase
VLDGPDLPQVDWFTEAALSTRHAFDQVVAACGEQAACAEALPELDRDWQAGLEALEASPVLTKAGDVEFEADGTAFLRYLRHGLVFPEFLTFYPLAMTRFDLDDFTEFTYRPMFSVGYVAPNVPSWFSHGVLYSVLCRDELPFVDRETLADAAGNEPSYVEAFVTNPYFEACERWNVPPAPEDSHVLTQSDVPALFMVGRFNPYSSLELINEAASQFANSQVVVFPTLGFNVLWNDCGRAVRNAWIDELATPDTTCIDDLPPVEFVVEP